MSTPETVDRLYGYIQASVWGNTGLVCSRYKNLLRNVLNLDTLPKVKKEYVESLMRGSLRREYVGDVYNARLFITLAYNVAHSPGET